MKVKLEFDIEDPEYWGVKGLFENIKRDVEFLFSQNCTGKDFKWEMVE